MVLVSSHSNFFTLSKIKTREIKVTLIFVLRVL